MMRGSPSTSMTGRGRRLDEPEVGQQVGLAGGAQLLLALVAADLGEDVDLRGHGLGCAAVPVEIRPVGSRQELSEFIELPFRLHSTSKQWVPPLRLERHAYLSRRLNPFFRHGDAQLLPRPPRRPRRRAASAPRSTTTSTRYHGSKWGNFGFLELEDDPEVMAALLDAAEGWLRERGMERARRARST